MKWFTSESIGMVYMQTTQKKWKTEKVAVETGPDAVVQEVKEAEIMHDSEPGLSLTLREEKRTAMSKIVEVVDPLCSIYDADLRNLAEMHELVVGENLSG